MTENELRNIKRQDKSIPVGNSLPHNYGLEKEDDYPANLMLVLGVVPADTEDEFAKQKEGLSAALNSQSMSDTERKVIKYRFEEHLTLREAGERLDVGGERIRQIEAKALRKLRHPSRRQMIAYGLERMKTIQSGEARIAELTNEIKQLENVRDELLEEIKKTGKSADDIQKMKKDIILLADIREEMSTRAYNLLTIRGKMKTLNELNGKTVKDLKNIRNMGVKSLEEILALAEKYGITIKEK